MGKTETKLGRLGLELPAGTHSATGERIARETSLFTLCQGLVSILHPLLHPHSTCLKWFPLSHFKAETN